MKDRAYDLKEKIVAETKQQIGKIIMIEIMIDLQGGAKAPLYEKYTNISNGMSLREKFLLGKSFRRQDFWQSICR